MLATDIWRQWLQMAQGSQEAARELEDEQPRSCISRIYYSAYQAVTAVLLYRGCILPTDREAWSHEATPQLIVDHWEPYLASLDRRKNLSRRLSTLYKFRVTADYKSNENIEDSAVRKAVKDGEFIVRSAVDILPGERSNVTSQ